MSIGVAKKLKKLRVILCGMIFCMIALPYLSSFAQERNILNRETYRKTINSNTVTILGASLSGSYIKIVDDIAKAVNDGHNLRVLPVIGEGGSQNIRDILYLKGVDAGIVMSTSLEAYRSDPRFKNIENNLHYIARLYDEEFHVIGGKNIKSVYDLKGKVVGFHGGAFVSGQLLLDKLGIERAKSIKINFFQGLEKVKTGEIAAIIRATARPMKGLDSSFDPQFHRLVPVKFNTSLAKSYAPATLTHKDYPKVIGQGQKVETVTIGVILAAFAHRPNTDRYRRLSKFTNALFSNFQKILKRKKRHKKWDEVNLAAKLPGWQRFKPAQEWINNAKTQTARRARFQAFVKRNSKSLNGQQMDTIFARFLDWEKKQKQKQ